MANGSIDNLNFKILLDDSEFKAKVNSSISEAKRLNAALTSAFNTKSSNANLATTSGELEKVSVKAQKASKSASSLSRAWLGFTAVFWSVISVVRIFTRAIGSAIRNISNFQQANANLATIMQVSRKEIEVLTNDALMLGRTTEWTASQVTELQTALAKLGYTIPQIRNMQGSVLQFATSVGAKLPEAAELAGASLRMFGMHSSEMQKALEILTASTNKTALDFEKLKTSLPYAGSVAHSIGFDIAETASLLGVLANSGLNASRIGTGLRQILIELSKTNGKLQTAMGGNIKTFDDFVNGLQHLRDRGFEAGEAAKLVSTRASNALLILANGVDDIRRLNNEVRDTDGLLKNIQRDRLDTLHGATLLLKSAWEGLIQTFRDSAGPMKDVVDGLTNIVRALSLASSRANRVAQGTKNVMGSDELTRRFKFQFEELLKNGTPVEEAAKIVQDSMQKWLNGAFGDLADAQHKGYSESGWNRALYGNPITHFFVSRKMDRGRAANEQVEAVENAMDAVTAYMANRAKEEADIAANNYLEEWKLIFDTEGEKAARAAMDAVTGYENIKSRMEAYMAEGGDEGARERSKAERDAAARAAEDARRKQIRDLESQIGLLRTFKNAYDDLAKSGMSGGEAEQFLLNIFPDFADIIKTADFDKAITAELEKLKTLDPEAYKSLALSLGNEGLAKALKELTEAGKENKTVEPLSQSQIDSLASGAFKSATSGMNLKRYGNKSIFGVADIIKELKELKFSADMLDAETMKKVDSGAVSLAQLEEVFEKMKKDKTDEAAASFAKKLKDIAGGLVELSSSITEYGAASGNDFLKGIGEAVSSLSGLAESVAQGFATGGWIGAVVAGLVSYGKELLKELAYAEELEQKITSTRIAKWAEDMNNALNGDGFFGENGLAKIRASADVAAASLAKLQSVTNGIGDGTKIKTIDRGWLGEGWLGDKVEKLGKVAAKLGYDLYDAYGNINSEALQAILDTYDKLGSKDRKWMEEAIVYAEEYKTALEALEEVTQSIFGDLASSAADAIVESWATAGDAALDYADILDDVAKRYAKMLVQSTLIDSVLTPDFKSELNALVGSGDVEGAMAKVADGMARIQAMAPQIQEILSPLVPYLNGNESGAESSLGNGIKSITEDTANLLAAYINGIRADVAAGNSQRAEILALVREYVGAGSAPSYTEYLTHIEAHTQNIAANTNAILSELRSIITPESGLPAVRVQTA